MHGVGVVAGWAALVAASLVAGAVLAARARLPERLAALITGFGGGILLAAVALELVPEADARAGRTWTALGLFAGALIYVGADAWLSRDETMDKTRRSRHASASGQPSMMPQPSAESVRGETIAAGIVVDGIPESLALGLMATQGGSGLALLIAVVVGNITESYAAAQPIISGGRSAASAVRLLSAIGVILGLMTVLGGTAGAAAPDVLIGSAQAVAAGAVLAVLSISILPYAFDKANRQVALVATLGFTLGYLLSS